jgi:hypothetical protein
MSPPQGDKEMLLWMCKAGVWGEWVSGFKLLVAGAIDTGIAR